MTDDRKQDGAVTGRWGATCHTSAGNPCNGMPLKGSTVCQAHLRNPKARANAAMRAAVMPFDPHLPDVDPGMVLLRMLSYASDRQRHYAGLLRRQYEALGPDPTLEDEVALATFGTYAEGGKSGEQVRALVRWEAHWLAETARLAKLALDAGIAERTVRLAAQQVQLMVDVGEHLLRALSAHVSAQVAAGLPVVLDRKDPAVRALVAAAMTTVDGSVA